jgi:hypothetical protein
MTEKFNIIELVEDFNQYITKVTSGSLVIAENLRKKQISIALKDITNFVEGMNWLISVSKYLKVQNVETGFDEQKIVGYFEEINEGLTVQDYFLVADLFEYEIAQYFENIPGVVVEN